MTDKNQNNIEKEIAQVTTQINLDVAAKDDEKIFTSLRELIAIASRDKRVKTLALMFVSKYPHFLTRIQSLYQEFGIQFKEDLAYQTEENDTNDESTHNSDEFETQEHLKTLQRLLHRAISTLGLGDYETCINLCIQGLEILEGLSSRGGYAQEVETQLRDLVNQAQYRLDRRHHLNKGIRLVNEGKWVEAHNLFQDALEYFPNDELFKDELEKLEQALEIERHLERRISQLRIEPEDAENLLELQRDLLDLPNKIGISSSPTERQQRLIDSLSDLKQHMISRFNLDARRSLMLSQKANTSADRQRFLNDARDHLKLVEKLDNLDSESHKMLQIVMQETQQISANQREQDQRILSRKTLWETFKDRLDDAVSFFQNTISSNATPLDILDEDTKNDCSQVSFTAFYPREISLNLQFALIVYASIPDAILEIQRDVTKFKDDLGGKIPNPKTANNNVCLEIGTPITVSIESEKLEFEPLSITKKWRQNWVRFDFNFHTSDSLVGQTIIFRISIKVYGIEIASIENCAVEIVKPEQSTLTDSSVVDSSNPLLLAKYQSQTTAPYQRIFISYSRRDSGVAKSYKLAQTALGNDAFLDVDNLRTGEDWRAALARAIDEADIFQLFWSEHSAISEYCRYEWDYAMKVRCPEDNCEGFIRPVYWRKPMPSPPPELSRINFRFVPFEDQDE